jgi:MFS family permease
MSTSAVDLSGPGAADTSRLENVSRGRVVFIVLAIVLSTEIVPFHFSFISLSAHNIGLSFPHQTAGELTWLTTLYSIVGGIAVPLFGKISDLVGKKAVMVSCLSVSIVGCVIDAATSSWTLMLVGRGLQGLAYPAIFIAFGLIRDLVPRRYLNLAVGIAGGGTGFGTVLGPIAGGILTDHFSWRSLFWFCVVWTAVTVLPLIFLVPETRVRAKVKIDVLGGVLLGLGVGGVLIYLSNGGTWGWGRISSLAWLIGGLVVLALFYAWEHIVSDPLLDPRLLRAPRFSGVMLAGFLSIGIMQGLVYLLGYLSETPGGAAGEAVKQQVVAGAAQQAAADASATMHVHLDPAMVLHYFSVQGTLPGFDLSLMQFTLRIMLIMSVLSVIVAPLCGWLSTRIGLQRPFVLSGVAFVAAALLYAQFHHSMTPLILITVLTGIGTGAYLGTLPNMVVETVPAEHQGVSGGLYGAFGSFGTAASSAAIAAVMSAHPLILHVNAPGHVEDVKLNTGPLAQLPEASAYTVSFYLFAGAAAVMLLLALVMRSFRRPATGGVQAEQPSPAAAE